MKKLLNLLKKFKNIVFLDFEGTQLSHEMISIGAISCSIDPKTGYIKEEKKPFQIYVKAKNPVGKYVENLTGIKDDLLKEKGVSFAKAMEELKKYIGINFKKSKYITFGNHDMRILSQSCAYNINAPLDICKVIKSNYIDFMSFISSYVRDSKSNPMSLIHYCEMFEIDLYGTPHDPVADAINLAHLYDAFLRKKELVENEYLKYLSLGQPSWPDPVKQVIKKLSNGSSITPEDYKEIIKDTIK